jgi:hypothetical protein
MSVQAQVLLIPGLAIWPLRPADLAVASRGLVVRQCSIDSWRPLPAGPAGPAGSTTPLRPGEQRRMWRSGAS